MIENLKIHDGITNKFLFCKLPSSITFITTILHYSSKPFFPATNQTVPNERIT